MTDKEEIIINGVDVSKCDKLIVKILYIINKAKDGNNE